jgi:hypothetical protein
MGRVAELGCFVCHHVGYGHQPAQVHHIRAGQGMAQRAEHFMTVPLCDRHHANSSPDGIHGQRNEWKRHSLDEMDALAWTIERLNT